MKEAPWKALSGPLHYDLNLVFLHGLSNLPMNNVATAPVQHRTEIVKSAAYVDGCDVNVPVVMWSIWLFETRSFF